MTRKKVTDSEITLVVDLKNISDSDLIYIRNRVRWECERRIKKRNGE